MPGLLRGIARTAVVAGTATAVSNRVSRRQAERWQQQGRSPYGRPEPAYQAPAPQYQEPPSPPPQQDMVQQLRDLAELMTRASSPRRSSPPKKPGSSVADQATVVTRR